jgi:hypothetical protein
MLSCRPKQPCGSVIGCSRETLVFEVSTPNVDDYHAWGKDMLQAHLQELLLGSEAELQHGWESFSGR